MTVQPLQLLMLLNNQTNMVTILWTGNKGRAMDAGFGFDEGARKQLRIIRLFIL
jgi:hypothetical protein